MLLLLACQPEPTHAWAYVHPELVAIEGSNAPLYPYQLFKPKDLLPKGPVCVEAKVNQDKEIQHVVGVWERWAPGVYGHGDRDFQVPESWVPRALCGTYMDAESFAYVDYLQTLHGAPSPYEAERQAAQARGAHWSQVVDDKLTRDQAALERTE